MFKGDKWGTFVYKSGIGIWCVHIDSNEMQ